MVSTIKFSEMTPGGDLPKDSKTPGLLSGINVLFNNPWTFLAAGTTGERPMPAPAMYNRLRFNETLSTYEYFDSDSATWAQLSGSGTGTVNPGNTNDLAFYASAGQAISSINRAANSVLVTDAGMVPSLSTTLPSGISIPNATITASTAALTSGSVIAAPTLGTSLTNKTYVDSLFSSGVISATGSANQVLVNGTVGVPQTGALLLSLPQDIATGSTPSFMGLTLSSIPLGVSSGGTGISNPANHGILLGQGISPVLPIVLGVGQILIGTTASDPAAATLTAGTGISIISSSGAITISATGGIVASTIAGTTQAAVVNSFYVVGNAALTTITLPTTFAVGDVIVVKGFGAAGWVLQANAGDTIKYGQQTTSSGGTLTSANNFDTVHISGIVADTTWSVDYAQTSGLTYA